MDAPHDVADESTEQHAPGNVQREVDPEVHAAVSDEGRPSKQHPHPGAAAEEEPEVQGNAGIVRGVRTDKSKTPSSVRLILSRWRHDVHVIAQFNGMRRPEPLHARLDDPRGDDVCSCDAKGKEEHPHEGAVPCSV